MIKLNEIQAKYGEYLVDEDKLKELLVKPKPKTVWDLEKGDTYYFIETNGGVYSCCWLADVNDLCRIEFGNVFLTKEEAKFELERRKCEAIMLKYGRRTFKYGKHNYFIVIFDKRMIIESAFNLLIYYQGTIYFDTEELTQKAIDEIGEERLKKYIFRVEK